MVEIKDLEYKDFFMFVENEPTLIDYFGDDGELEWHRALLKNKTEIALIQINLPKHCIHEIANYIQLLKKVYSFNIGCILPIYNILFGKFEEQEQLWIFTQPIYPISIHSYVFKQHITQDQMNFLAGDLLHINCSLSSIQTLIYFTEESFVLSRDPASPFPRLLVSPSCFIIPYIINQKSDINIVITHYLELIWKIPDAHIIINSLKNGVSIQQIVQHPIIQRLIHFIQGEQSEITDYKPIETIGNGGFGIVMKCSNSHNEIVAIKESNGINSSTLQREATILRLCNHPNVVKFIGFCTSQFSFAYDLGLVSPRTLSNSFLIMEYCDGGNLDNYIQQFASRGELPSLELVMDLFRQIALCQRYLHYEKGFIHRDIKLENFLLIHHQPFPLLKITDFGFGRSLADEMDTIKFSPLFAAPQMFEQTTYSSKSDLYSIGVCLYRLTTCRFPFATTKTEFIQQMKEKKKVQFPAMFINDCRYSGIIELVMKLMVYEEKDRMSWEEFYSHPFMVHLLK
ncbi:hypothetical protein ENUP19_0236G0006 [Entamoeba nuttalli]|uniref:Protein kinase domain containing protein n=2 Tax=Entamoeba nuttalli TaxID=412467 RepID=K2HWX3_ENTNP|nr:protein kinase domain containing protein [Entamoeba nuttalli P19]EKE40790.1 protein kinase domain containing protein [Entamoeba nuttalli P19]|eukprot:XP_008856859.1 protein kinase domain containing protein [Entamoeba nuttalli P19]